MLPRYAVPLAVTVLVLVGAVAGPSALADAVTGLAPEGARLEVGWGYVAMAPVTNVLDALSVLTLGQHYAVLASLLLLYAGWRIVRSRRRLGPARRLAAEVGVALVSLAGLLAFYAYGIVGPRPMAALAMDDSAAVIVDIHSHTDYSHDGRDGFSAADNRAWHAGAGFDAVYVTDHRTWRGWLDAVDGNPVRAGDGTVLLPGLEVKWRDTYACALGEPWRYERAMEGNDLIVDSIYRVYRETGVRPTLVVTIPEDLEHIPPSAEDSLGFVAIELSDASPRGLRQSRQDREFLVRMADSLNLAPVAATNNHGWGRTAAAWTVMRIPGWRELTPEALGAAIERTFHERRRSASVVVERRSGWVGESPAALAATLPSVVWTIFGGMGVAERVSWLAWSWGLWLILVAARSRDGPPGTRGPARE